MTPKEISEFIREQRAAQKLSIFTLSEMSEISQFSVYTIERGERFGTELARKLLKALGYNIKLREGNIYAIAIPENIGR